MDKQLVMKRLSAIDKKMRKLEIIMRRNCLRKMTYNYKLPI